MVRTGISGREAGQGQVGEVVEDKRKDLLAIISRGLQSLLES